MDSDGTGEIELEEFLEIFTKQNPKEENKDSRLKDFFTHLESGEYKEQKDRVSFNFYLSKLRRKIILEALQDKTSDKK